ncbi:aldose epimerase family protein [Sphingobacterium sp. Mn56C]|uniref:aldose epimerase family protein n=1 Tax=Sphingobacterium sp. Mn56C TaxID=3395261 RepID=UPI003BD4B4B4
MTIYTLPKHIDFEGQVNAKNTHLFTLKNRTGMEVAFTDFGARIVSILVPDKNGNLIDVALGFKSIHDYFAADEKYHGASVGRYANRIANGRFELEGKTYTLQQNNGPNSLHGGPQGFHNKVWDRQVSMQKKVDFYYTSPDGEEGFPGTLNVHVSYELSNDNEIIIHYRATTDKTTVVNLTNHTYFNLNGEGDGDILSHMVEIPAETYLPIDEHAIPFGFESPVDETAFDFRLARKIVEALNPEDEQIQRGHGYDHTFVNKQPLTQVAATVYSEVSGIKLDVFTTEPGIQFYTGNFLSGKDTGKSGNRYLSQSAFCLETQHFPDSPNRSNFPSVVLKPGAVFESTTIYKFGLVK